MEYGKTRNLLSILFSCLQIFALFPSFTSIFASFLTLSMYCQKISNSIAVIQLSFDILTYSYEKHMHMH